MSDQEGHRRCKCSYLLTINIFIQSTMASQEEAYPERPLSTRMSLSAGGMGAVFKGTSVPALTRARLQAARIEMVDVLIVSEIKRMALKRRSWDSVHRWLKLTAKLRNTCYIRR